MRACGDRSARNLFSPANQTGNVLNNGTPLALPFRLSGAAVPSNQKKKGTGFGADRLPNDEILIGRCRVAKVGQRWMLDPYLESEQGSLAKSLQYK